MRGIISASIGFIDNWVSICLAGPNADSPRAPSLPVFVPEGQNEVWSADFMSEALSHGSRLQTFNIIADFNREAFAIEMDTSLPAEPRLNV